MTKKRKVEYRKLKAEAEEAEVQAPETAAPMAVAPEAEAPQPEAQVAPTAEREPEAPVPRAPSPTPRQLAAILNEPRRTPAVGVPVISTATPSPVAVAASLASQQAASAEPEQDLSEVLLFRLGGERFAASLAAIDEAVDLPELHPIPESPPDLLGVFELRGRLVPLYSAARALRLDAPDGIPPCAFILSHAGMRIGIAVDGLDDAVAIPAESLREAPDSEDGDGVLLGVAHVGAGVVTIVSASALARTCLESGSHGRTESSAATEAA